MRWVLVVLLMVLAAQILPSAQGSADGYSALISGVVASIQDGKFAEAVTQATRAISQAPNRYEGHMYLGIAKFRQDALGEATVAWERALALAPDSQKARVQEMLARAAGTDQFRTHMADAEQAERGGAWARAASGYAAAWERSPERLDVASKALRLFLQTGDHFEAARIWRWITPEHRKQNPSLFDGISIDSRQLDAEIARRRPLLSAAIQSGREADALGLAVPLGQAAPEKFKAVVATLCFLRGDASCGTTWAQGLQPIQLTDADYFSEAQMNRLLATEGFQRYLTDVVGGGMARHGAALQLAVSYPRQLAEARAVAHPSARTNALLKLWREHPDRGWALDDEVKAASKAAADQVYRDIQTMLTSMRTAVLQNGGSVSYRNVVVRPCVDITLDAHIEHPSNYSKGSHFRYDINLRLSSDDSTHEPQITFEIGSGNVRRSADDGDNPTLTVSGPQVSTAESSQYVQLDGRKDIGWKNYRQGNQFVFYFSRVSTGYPPELRRLLEQARVTCRLGTYGPNMVVAR